MAAAMDFPPLGGGGTRPPDPRTTPREPSSYSQKLKTNIKWDSRLKRNILEIILDNDNKEFVELNDEVMHRLFMTLGIIKSQVEGYFRKNNAIKVWLATGINLDRFCRSESIKIANGIRTKFIRPSGKKEVTVKVSGLDFNTPDSFVIEYLGKFGKVVPNSVIYDKYKEGHFAGKYNGDRKYSVDFTQKGTNMGTFHIIDGDRVKIFYNGNKKTCARCHQTAETCKGEAVASDCEANDGERFPLVDHMKTLWAMVGFEPFSFELNVDELDLEANVGGDVTIKDKAVFSPNIKRPNPSGKDIEKYVGVTVNNFPKQLAKTDIVSFLQEHGLSDKCNKDSIALSDTKNGTNVEISPLDQDTVDKLIKKINFSETRTKFFDRPLYCRALRELTPTKVVEKEDDNKIEDSTKVVEKKDDKIEDSTKDKEKKVGNNDNIVNVKKFGKTDPVEKQPSGDLNSSTDADDFEWHDTDNTDAKEPANKLFRKVNGDESSEDETDEAKKNREKFLKKKNVTTKRNRNSSGKAGKLDKKLKK